MKKLFTLFVVLVASVGMMFAESGTCGENLTWDLTNGVLTIRGSGAMQRYRYGWSNYKWEIKSIIIHDGVTTIEDWAFNQCTSLQSVTIPNTVTRIGTSTFAECISLSSVVIPGSVTRIGQNAFYGCQNLASLTLSEGITTIVSSAFEGCVELTSVSIPTSVTTIGLRAFYGCTKLSSVTFPNSVTSIGYNVFTYCDSLKVPVYNDKFFVYLPMDYSGHYSIPEGIEQIISGACYNCTGLTSVTLPESVTTIGESAFGNCTGLISITLPNTVTTINRTPFYGSGIPVPVYNDHLFAYMPESYAGAYTIPDGIEQIVGDAFANCIGLTDITIPNSVKRIGLWAFDNCTGLTNVTIPNSVTTIEPYAFYGCSNLASITLGNSVELIDMHAFEDCISIESIELPNSLITIGDQAFNGCTSLTALEIPSNVFNIGDGITIFCSNLTSITVVPDNQMFLAIDGVLFSKDTTTILQCPPAKQGVYCLPRSVANIKKHAFYNCAELTSLTIPNSVTNIESYAFDKCGQLTSITCEAATPPTLERFAFSNTEKAATLYVPGQSIDLYKTADQWKEFTNILPIGGEVIVGSSCDNPIIVEDDVYESRYSMDPQGTKWYRVTNIPDIRNQGLGLTISVFNTSMKSSANIKLYYDCNQSAPFRQAELNPAWEWKINLSQEDYNQLFASGEPSLLIECTAESACLLEFDIKDLCYVASGTCGDSLTWKLSCDSVLTISGTGEMTKFESYSAVPWYSKTGSITSVVIEEGVTSIGRDAFYSCSRLASVTIPNSVTRIGSNAFEYCISLTSIELPNSLTSIEYGVFWGCTNLTSILIPNSVTSIGWDAFYGCRSLTSIEIPNRVTSIGMNAFVGCSGITSLDIPNSVTNIEPGAFSSCTNLISVELPDSITTIEDSVFISCANLTSIEIPGGVTSIGLLAFYRCSGLTSITCQSVTPPTLGPEAFGYVDKSIPLYVPGASIDAYKAAEGWKEFFNILPISGTAIPEYSVIFLNWNGELLSEQSIAHNEAAVAPELPEREGFIFKGWTADIEHIIARTFAIALYDKVGVEVTYKAEDGEVLFSEHADLHFPNVPSIDGKTFSGWLTEMADNTNGIVLRATYTVDKPTEDDDVNVVPSSTTADVNFPYVTGAITYMLVISDMSDQVVCKIMFDANGKLLGIAFAPGRNGNKQQTPQVFGFTFKVEGLNPNTTYKYEFVAHDDEDEVIETLTGSFTTMAEAPSDVEYPEAENLSSVTKFIQDDQVLILRGDKAYTATGQEVK